MSKESVNEFMLDVSERPELKKILKKSKKKLSSNEDRFEYVAQEAKKYGYDFTASDMILAMGERSSGLLDDDLADVAGGQGNPSIDNSRQFWNWFR
jgi:hypothetical protein